MFGDILNFHSFVQEALPERVVKIVDPILFQGIEEDISMNDSHNKNSTRGSEIHECLILILEIGVACSVEDPKERMSIKDAGTKLHLIKKKLLQTIRHGSGRIPSRS
jgi:hypothetical protein